MRQVLIMVAVWGLALTAAFAAQAQQVKLSDGTYPSTAAYLEGTWKWERQEPRQTVIMRFNRDGSFFFHNFTIDRQHWGRYTAVGQKLSIGLTRTCDKKGSECGNYDPPKNVEYTVTPTTANMFMAQSERWERMK